MLKIMGLGAFLRRASGGGKKAALALFATLGFTAAAISNWATVQQSAIRWFGNDDASLVVLRGRLIPFFARIPDSPDRDQLMLQFELRKYGASSVILTAADIAIVNSASATIGTGGTTPGEGGCGLSARPTDNEPIEVGPGQSVWLEISPMVNLPGLGAWLDSGVLDNVHVVEGFPLTIHELSVIDKLNEELAQRFGRDAKIRVTLFTGLREKRRTVSFSLTKGVTVFSSNGELMHDALISYWLSPTSKAAMLGCRDGSKP